MLGCPIRPRASTRPQSIGPTARRPSKPGQVRQPPPAEDSITLVVQVNGKVCGRLEVSPGISAADAKQQALSAGHRTTQSISSAPFLRFSIVIRQRSRIGISA